MSGALTFERVSQLRPSYPSATYVHLFPCCVISKKKQRQHSSSKPALSLIFIFVVSFSVFNLPAVKSQRLSRHPALITGLVVSRLSRSPILLSLSLPRTQHRTTSDCLFSLVYLGSSLLLWSIYSVTLVYLEVVGKNLLRLYGYLHDIPSILWSTVGKTLEKEPNRSASPVKLIIESCLAEPRKSNKKHDECYF